MEGILAIIFIFGGGTAFLLAVSPVGRAFADRIRGGMLGDEEVRRLEASHQEVLEELEAMRRDLVDLHERMDFSERVIAQNRPGALPPSDGTT